MQGLRFLLRKRSFPAQSQAGLQGGTMQIPRVTQAQRVRVRIHQAKQTEKRELIRPEVTRRISALI